MDVLGLPLHPLVVHAAVVLLPLAAVGALILSVAPRWRERYGWLNFGFAVAAYAAALVARLSGLDLADRTGLRGTPAVAAHEAWGQWAPRPALLLAVGLLALLLLDRRKDRDGDALHWAAVVLTVLAALATLVVVGVTGHLGATAVWG